MLAWLHASPTPDKPPKGFQPKSRLEAFRESGEAPVLPPCPSVGLVDLLFEAGPYSITGMGSAPLSWQEIEAWLRVTGRSLSYYLSKQIYTLSAIYLAEYKRSEKIDHPMPYIARVTIEQNRDRVSGQIQAAFKGRPASGRQARRK